MQRRGIKFDIVLPDSRSGMDILVRSAFSAVAWVPWLDTRRAIFPPKEPKEGALQPGEVVGDCSGAPAIRNLDGVECATVLFDDHLDSSVFKRKHASDIVHLILGGVS